MKNRQSLRGSRICSRRLPQWKLADLDSSEIEEWRSGIFSMRPLKPKFQSRLSSWKGPKTQFSGSRIPQNNFFVKQKIIFTISHIRKRKNNVRSKLVTYGWNARYITCHCTFCTVPILSFRTLFYSRIFMNIRTNRVDFEGEFYRSK